jgi:tetratricopeptide (TPR) repeat protein
MADDSPTDASKKWWWLAAVAVPVAVAIIAILPDMIPPDNESGGDTFRVIGSQFNDEVTFNTFNVVMDQAGQAGIELSERELTTLRQAFDLLQDRRFDAAIPLLESLEQAVPVPAVLNNLGAAYLATGSTNQAKGAFERALSEAPDQESARSNLTKIDVEANPEPEPVKEVVKTKVKVSAVLAEGGPAQVSNFVIYNKGLDEYGQAKLNQVSYHNGAQEATFTVPAGSYVLHAAHANAFAEREIVVEAGKPQVLQLVYHAGRVKVSAVLAEGGPAQVSNFVIFKKGLDEYGQAKLDQVSYHNGAREATFTVPAGSYVLHAAHANASVEKEITISEGASQIVQMILQN